MWRKIVKISVMFWKEIIEYTKINKINYSVNNNRSLNAHYSLKITKFTSAIPWTPQEKTNGIPKYSKNVA